MPGGSTAHLGREGGGGTAFGRGQKSQIGGKGEVKERGRSGLDWPGMERARDGEGGGCDFAPVVSQPSHAGSKRTAQAATAMMLAAS